MYGVTEAWVSDRAFPCESGVPFGIPALASHRIPHPSQSALAGQRLRFSAKRNGGAVSDSAFPCELGIPFSLSSLASHRLPRPSLPALAGQRIRFRPNGMAVRRPLARWLTIVRSFVRVGVVERAVVATQRQHARANASGHLTSIPFGHHAISKTLALADDIALSEPPDICRPNGISVSQVYGVTAECVFFKKPAIPGFFFLCVDEKLPITLSFPSKRRSAILSQPTPLHVGSIPSVSRHDVPNFTLRNLAQNLLHIPPSMK